MRIQVGKTYRGRGVKVILRRVTSIDGQTVHVEETKHLTNKTTTSELTLNMSAMRSWAAEECAEGEPVAPVVVEPAPADIAGTNPPEIPAESAPETNETEYVIPKL